MSAFLVGKRHYWHSVSKYYKDKLNTSNIIQNHDLSQLLGYLVQSLAVKVFIICQNKNNNKTNKTYTNISTEPVNHCMLTAKECMVNCLNHDTYHVQKLCEKNFFSK